MMEWPDLRCVFPRASVLSDADRTLQLTNALDAGCGTDFIRLYWAQLGLQVTATDISEEMLKQTRKHAKDYASYQNNQLNFPRWEKLIQTRFDSVFCLGNTIAHLLTERVFLSSFKSFYEGDETWGNIISSDSQLRPHPRTTPSYPKYQGGKRKDVCSILRLWREINPFQYPHCWKE